MVPSSEEEQAPAAIVIRGWNDKEVEGAGEEGCPPAAAVPASALAPETEQWKLVVEGLEAFFEDLLCLDTLKRRARLQAMSNKPPREYESLIHP